MIQETTNAVANDNGTTANDVVRELALAPLVEKLAYGLARIFAVAMRDLEDHIAGENRKLGETVGRRLDSLQTSVQDLAAALSEQQAVGRAVQAKCEQLAASTAALQERDVRHEAGLSALRNATQDLSKSATERIDALARELGLHQEDLTTIKSTTTDISSQVDNLVERLERQSEALRSLYATNAQRDTELDQLMDGLTKLRSTRTAAPAGRL